VSASIHAAPPGAPRVNTKLLDGLVAEALIQFADHEAVGGYAKRRQIHVEEALIQMGLLDEAQLLKFQSSFYKTFFVSTKKLSTAPIPESLLKMVPHKLAVKLCIFPVRFDAKTQELSILTVEPDDLDVLKSVQFATRAPKVKALVARPAAIQAAIRLHFEGESQAFMMVRSATSAASTGGGGDRDLKRHTLGYEQTTAVHSPPPPPSRDSVFYVPPEADPNPILPPTPPRVTITAKNRAMPRPEGALPALPPVRASMLPSSGHHGAEMPLSMLPPQTMSPPAGAMQALGGGVVFGDEEIDFSGSADAVPMPKKAPAGISVHDYLETLNVLLALLENERGELRNHSVQVARVCGRLCERLGLRPEESDAIVIAAYLHDVGKAPAHHLTALNVAEYEPHRQQARKSYLTPVRMFEAVRLPPEVTLSLTHLYERFDGQGFPDRLAGKEICLGARVLAIVETYTDLVGHSGNSYRKKLEPQEAWDVLAKYKGKIFDPGLVDVFKRVVLGDDLRAKLLADRRRALLVDSDAEETTVLDLRLAEHGFDVTIARNSQDAETQLAGDFDVIISEVDLRPLDGFELLEKIRAAGNEVPLIFYSKTVDGDVVQRGFALGAADFITKPASAELLALKVTRVLDGARRAKRKTGVNGSLTEMSLPDVVQILCHGRKSGKLTIDVKGKQGEILFSDGMIWDAKFGTTLREDAFYAMLRLREGDFELDPNFKPTEQVIEASPESLLLEGMRRFDESGR
jgi:response regulator RpfG family c-di-GMP phosphodiesterase